MQVELTNGIMPTRGSEGAAGLDLYTPKAYHLKEGLHLIPLGIKIALPAGHYGQLLCRSSLAIKGCSVEGGVIDQDYRGEVKLLLRTRREMNINAGDRVAQMVILPCWMGTPELNKLDQTRRAEGGFGSTNKTI
tara:strand:- start:360 stop:761 length:402 start_codon:yes stop_codon:yes gene_type:complete